MRELFAVGIEWYWGRSGARDPKVVSGRIVVVVVVVAAVVVGGGVRDNNSVATR